MDDHVDVLEAARVEAGISREDLFCRDRIPKLCEARRNVAFALRTLCPDLSLPDLAKLLRVAHHTTILYRIRASARNGGVEFSNRVRKRLEN